jgi:hypothetical protein
MATLPTANLAGLPALHPTPAGLPRPVPGIPASPLGPGAGLPKPPMALAGPTLSGTGPPGAGGGGLPIEGIMNSLFGGTKVGRGGPGSKRRMRFRKPKIPRLIK